MSSPSTIRRTTPQKRMSWLIALLVGGSLLLPALAAARTVIVVRPRMRPVVVVRTPAPRPVFVRRVVRPLRKVWVPGHWTVIPRGARVWVRGHYRFVR
ncbi:MAG: hypothetical protein KAY32_11420 [Candidatus Eisenbacteria sp.]|nr:hypothetical protein [Candidatus Eisenbacteria bacterium]